MKGPCLISGFFGCCRTFASGASQPEGKSKSESLRKELFRSLVGARSSSHVRVDTVMVYGGPRGSKVYDGEHGLGGECMSRHQCLSTEYVCSPVVSNLFVT